MTTATTDNPTANPAGGPRTAEGKKKSRRNALKDGLRSKDVFPEELEKVINELHRDFIDEFKPGSAYEDSLLHQMAVASAKSRTCASFISADIIVAAKRAADHWDSDRMDSVDRYAKKLPDEPLRVARGLLRTKQGAEWLIQHWIQLKASVLENGCWTEDQRKLAFDLLGIPHVLRTHHGDVPRGDDTDRILKLIDRKLEELLNRQDELEDLDETEREMAMMGMPLEENSRTKRLRREENRAHRDFHKASEALFHYRATGIIPTTKARPKPETDRAPLSKAAEDNLVKRSEMPREIVRVEEEPTPAPAPAPAPARVPVPVPGSSQKRPNRLARKQQARREREAVKAAEKAAAKR